MKPRRPKSFYPDYLVEVLVVALLTVEAILALALLWPPSLGRVIDLSASYRPKPEWYFLWLYQLLKYFPGPWAFLGAVLLPLGAAGLFVLLPWLDRGPRGRTKVLLAGGFLLASVIALSLLAELRP